MNDDFDNIIDETRAFLAARPAPDVTADVMRRIQTVEPQRSVSLVDRVLTLLWAPRQISFRPAFALAGAAAIVILIVVTSVNRPSPVEQVAERPVDRRLFVQFRLQADASRVQLAGSFTNWEPRYELRQTTPGVWTITVPLTEGVHDYAFVVDGQQWVADPHAPQIGDGFGGTNSRLALLSPDTPQL